jgi:hypothetical protein
MHTLLIDLHSDNFDTNLLPVPPAPSAVDKWPFTEALVHTLEKEKTILIFTKDTGANFGYPSGKNAGSFVGLSYSFVDSTGQSS